MLQFECRAASMSTAAAMRYGGSSSSRLCSSPFTTNISSFCHSTRLTPLSSSIRFTTLAHSSPVHHVQRSWPLTRLPLYTNSDSTSHSFRSSQLQQQRRSQSSRSSNSQQSSSNSNSWRNSTWFRGLKYSVYTIAGFTFVTFCASRMLSAQAWNEAMEYALAHNESFVRSWQERAALQAQQQAKEGGDSHSLATKIEFGGVHFQRTFLVILAVNAVVFLAWQNPAFHGVLNRHFLLRHVDVVRNRRWHQLLTSSFSHATPMHLLFNMIALWSMCDGVIAVMGEKQFAGFYLFSCVSSALLGMTMSRMLLSVVRNPALREMYLSTASLGASGAVMAVAALHCLLFPFSKFVIAFVIPITGEWLYRLLFAFDAGGMLYNFINFPHGSGLGHDVHMGGWLTGTACYYWLLATGNPKAKFIEEHNKRRRQQIQ